MQYGAEGPDYYLIEEGSLVKPVRRFKWDSLGRLTPSSQLAAT